MDAAPHDINTYIVFSQLLMLIVPLAAIINIAVSIWAGRRRPNITEELYRDFASKNDIHDIKSDNVSVERELKANMRELRIEFNAALAEYFQRQHNDQQAIEDKFQAIMASIGKIQGQLKKCPTTCPEN